MLSNVVYNYESWAGCFPTAKLAFSISSNYFDVNYIIITSDDE